MYKNLERIYINESPYNKIIKRLVLTYILICAVSVSSDLLYNLVHIRFLKTIILVITIIIIYGGAYIYLNSVFKKYLQIDLVTAFKNKKNTYIETINKKEYEKFKTYTINNNIYNEKSLNCILCHYRMMRQYEKSKKELLAFLAIAIPVVVDICNKKLSLIIISIIVITIVYYVFSSISEIKLIVSGKNGMNARLEEIFSELYIECINDSSKKRASKSTKKQSIMPKKK